ncbi:hypothetical protein [Thalassospira marina]|uniref:Uncharacterized protein n=1 Tax=Thalassospira marina TaxID=2048283 RepID=A0ABN5FDF0_9PROT|nr:hypothetical protein [Thalassospira marina]AUG52871.1 hypothetical protein CSC3H3_09255 [Thalassospira marina]
MTDPANTSSPNTPGTPNATGISPATSSAGPSNSISTPVAAVSGRAADHPQTSGISGDSSATRPQNGTDASANPATPAGVTPVSPLNSFVAVLTGGGDVAKLSAASLALVFSPLVLLAVLATFFTIDVLVSSWGGRLFGFSYDLVFFVGVFGALGATVSVMLYISDTQNWQNLTPLDIFFRFLFRPFLGFVFAILALLIVRAGIVPDSLSQLQAIRDLNDLGTLKLSDESGQQVAIMLLIAFLAGFSERLVKAILQTVEGRIRALAIGSDSAKTT